MPGLLDLTERNQLIDYLTHSSELQAPLAIPLLFQAAGLGELVPQLNLGGAMPFGAVIRQTESVLEDYGAITRDGPTALGTFLYQWVAGMGQGNHVRLWVEDLIRRRHLLGQPPDAQDPFRWKGSSDSATIPEGIHYANTLQNIAFFAEGLRKARSVVQVEVPQVRKGTGFLIGPTLVVTCHHVLHTVEEAQRAIFRLNFQETFDGHMESFVEYGAKSGGIFHTIDKDEHGVLFDYAVIELATPQGQPAPGEVWGYLHLEGDLMPLPESHANIIQHPAGLPKQVSFQDNLIAYVDEMVVQYRTATMQGASGSPVFDDRWRVIAMHRGSRRRDQIDGWSILLNEGLAVGAIVKTLPPHIRNKLG